MNISMLLQMAAETDPDRIALVCDGRRWSYEALWSGARRASAAFSASGCAHVALLDTSSEAAVFALFGAGIAGIPYVPLNYRLPDADLATLLTRIEPAFVIGDSARITASNGACGVSVDRVAFVDGLVVAGSDEIDAIDDGDTVAVQLFTSGTTAAPKAAILRHANLVSYILGSVEFCSAGEDEATLVSVPPYHIAGIAALLSSVYAMRRIVLLPSFDADAWIDLAATEQVTNAFVVPTMLARIIDRLDRRDVPASLGRLEALAYGGGRMPLELIGRALDLFPGARFTNAYGLTETSSTIALLGPDDHRTAHASDDPRIHRRLGSVGRPLPSVEIEIRDENGVCLPAGRPGEIYVRGPQVSGEYRERSALDADGWFPTRDAGFMDADGYLFLAGRADDVIVRGGENISPSEIEEVLLGHAAIADVAAVGVPSIEWGEAVGVAIVARPGHVAPDDDEVREMVRARLRSSRAPERILTLETLPYNEMGKLLRREVKRMFLADE